MSYDHLFIGLGLVLVLEGILPFACPSCWRQMMKMAALSSDTMLRLFGLSAMILGVVIIFLLNDAT